MNIRSAIIALLALAAMAVAGVPLTRLPAAGAAPDPPALGMVVDMDTDSVTIFDVATDSILGSVPLGIGARYDCSITEDMTLGFVTDFNFGIWVIDLTTSPPSLAAGTNPIPISNRGEDTSISPDQQFLVVADGGWIQPLSVIDIASRAEISTFFLASGAGSVEVLNEGSVLVTSSTTNALHRLTIDGVGNLTATGEVVLGGPTYRQSNPFGAPGGASGIVSEGYPTLIRSFTIPGLTPVDVRNLSGGGFGVSGVVNPGGNRVYARSNWGLNRGVVDAFSYDSATGVLGAAPLFSIPILSHAPSFYGVDQMAISPGGTKLYVSDAGALKVYDAGTGALLTSITGPNISRPTGVCTAGVPDLDGDGVFDADDLCPTTPADQRPVDPNGCSQKQVDGDLDGVCDSGAVSTLCSGSDNCPSVPNPGQQDTDGDGIGDACELPVGGTVELVSAPSDPSAGESDSSARDYAVPAAVAVAAGALALAAGAWYARRRLR